jgi:copper chaperone NosL
MNTHLPTACTAPMNRLRLGRRWSTCLAAMLLVACTQSKSPLAALEPGADTACTLDGMTLEDFPGPKAQIHYADGQPEFFCDLIELFAVVLLPEQKRHLLGIFVQDAGKTDWNQPKGNWIEAKSAFFVVGSRKTGSMGATFGAFSSAEMAAQFVEKEGGRVLRFAQITPAMVSKDGISRHASGTMSPPI